MRFHVALAVHAAYGLHLVSPNADLRAALSYARHGSDIFYHLLHSDFDRVVACYGLFSAPSRGTVLDAF